MSLFGRSGAPVRRGERGRAHEGRMGGRSTGRLLGWSRVKQLEPLRGMSFWVARLGFARDDSLPMDGGQL